MERHSPFVSGALVCLCCFAYLEAQVLPVHPKELSNDIDETAVKQYLDTIDEEIGRIALEYRQLASWTVPKGTTWSDPGKLRTTTRLEYAHARRPAQKPPPLVDRFGPDGFELEVRVVSKRYMSLVAGPSIGSFVFGSPLGGGCVMATLRLADPEHPQNKELARRVIAIVTQPEWTMSPPFQSCIT
jgi:hypothetical protein